MSGRNFAFMVKLSSLTKSVYKPKEIADFLNVTTKTLRNWERDGKLKFQKDSISGRRFMSRDILVGLLDLSGLLVRDTRYDAVYVRGSDSDVLRILGSRTDLKCVRVFMDDCTAVDGSRKQLDALVDEVLDGNVDRIFILSEDNLAEAGINYLKKVFKHNNVTLVSIL